MMDIIMEQAYGNVTIEAEVLIDEHPDTSWLEGEPYWADRWAAYKRGEFHFIGIRAKADIVVNETIQTITSGGLWGVESDSNQEHLDDIAKEEIDEVRDILKALRFYQPS